MLPTTHISPAAHKLSAAHNGPQDSSAPETGEFNFVDYLLGLQDKNDVEAIGQTEKGKASVLLAPASKGKTGKKEVGTNEQLLSTLAALPTALTPGQPNIKANLAKALTADTKEAPIANLKLEVKPLGKDLLPNSKLQVSTESKSTVLDPKTAFIAEKKISLDDASAKNSVSEKSRVVTKLVAEDNSATKPTAVDTTVRDQAVQKYSQMANSAHASVENLPKQVSAVASTKTPVEVKSIAPSAKKRTGKKEDGSELSLDGLSQVAQQHSESSVTGTKDIHHVEMAAGEKIGVPELMNRVNTLVHQGGGKMTVSLNPPHLGQVEVQVTARGNKIEVAMKSESTHAKSILETHAADLKQSLQSHDLVLSKMDVQVNRDFTPTSAKFAGMFNQDTSQNRSGQFQGEGQSRFAQPYTETSSVPRGRADFAPTGARSASLQDGRVDVRI